MYREYENCSGQNMCYKHGINEILFYQGGNDLIFFRILSLEIEILMILVALYIPVIL